MAAKIILTKSRGVLFWGRLVVMIAAVALVVVSSIETFSQRSFNLSYWGVCLQTIVCLLMSFEMGAEFVLSHRRVRYAATHWPLLILCVPWVLILRLGDVAIASEWLFLLQLLPIIRAIVVLAQLLSLLRFSTADSLFGAYIALLAAVLYFSSLMFYIAEDGVNPGIHSFRSAVYWAVMTMTTTGSNILEITPVGQALATVLAASGLILFPVFTVYIADATSRKDKNQS